MVKLLRYYVSEDAVYLHLEHVKGKLLTALLSVLPGFSKPILIVFSTSIVVGGRLFSKVHKLRKEKAKEHPECINSGHHIKLKTSYTSPTICADYQHNTRENTAQKLSDESPDAEYPTSWDETQQRLESCGTHSYIEETGCLQNTRSAASFYTKLDRPALLSGPTRTQVNTRIHPPAPSLCLHSTETQDKPALPLSCTRVNQTLDVMSEQKRAGVGLIECSSEFELAWKSADPAHTCEKKNPYAVTGSDLNSTLGQTAPFTSQTSFMKTESPNSESNGLSSSPAILHLPLHCQTQIRGRASWDNKGPHQGSVPSGHSADVTNVVQQSKDAKQESSSPSTEERNGVLVIRSTDRAVFSDHTDTLTTSEHPWPFSASLCNSAAQKQVTLSAIPTASDVKNKGGIFPSEAGQGACELLSAGEKVAPTKEGSFSGWFSSDPLGAQNNRIDVTDSFLKPERFDGQGEDQIIEVDGWCHLPRFLGKSSTPSDKAMQACWGLPESEVCVWGAQILLALESLHQQGILCRDLNPRNVLLTSNGQYQIIS